MNFLKKLLGQTSRDVTPLAERMYSLATCSLPYDRFWPDNTHDCNLSNRVYLSAAHAAQNLLSLCIATHFRSHWSDSIPGVVWGVFHQKARIQWVNQVKVSDILVWPDDLKNLHRELNAQITRTALNPLLESTQADLESKLLNRQTMTISLHDLSEHTDSMGAIFSIILKLRSDGFYDAMNLVESMSGPISFHSESFEELANTLCLMCYQEVCPRGSPLPSIEELTSLSNGLLDLSAYLIGGTYGLCRDYYA